MIQLVKLLPTLSTLMIAAVPALAEPLSNLEDQRVREYYSSLSKEACAGDPAAYEELDTQAGASAIAANSMAWLILQGEKCNVSHEFTKDDAVALQFKAASVGYPVALENVGNRLARGIDIPANPEAAVYFYYRAIRDGYGNSAAELGRVFAKADGPLYRPKYAAYLVSVARELGADQSRIDWLEKDLRNAGISLHVDRQHVDPWVYEGLDSIAPARLTMKRGMTSGAYWDGLGNGIPQARAFVGEWHPSAGTNRQQTLFGFSFAYPFPFDRVLGIQVQYTDGQVEQIFGPCAPCNVQELTDVAGGTWHATTWPIDGKLDQLKSASLIILNVAADPSAADQSVQRVPFPLKGSYDALTAFEQNRPDPSFNPRVVPTDETAGYTPTLEVTEEYLDGLLEYLRDEDSPMKVFREN